MGWIKRWAPSKPGAYYGAAQHDSQREQQQQTRRPRPQKPAKEK